MSRAGAQTLGPRDLARETGVSSDTLRHYERKGVLPRPARTAAGYRRYPAEAVARVHLVQRALVVGFSLDELARILRERDAGGAPCRSVREIVAARLADLDRRLEELQALRVELRELLGEWDDRLTRTPRRQQARLLDTLGEKPTIERVRAARPFGRNRR
jgi:DNA-binding transcriptional MerR regulator